MRASTGRPPPDDVVDILLWRLATDVAANHQPHPLQAGRCAHPRCVGEAYPCPPARDARRALHASRAAAPPAAQARSRSAVPRPGWDWFRPSRSPADPRVAGQPRMLPRRHPAAGLRAA